MHYVSDSSLSVYFLASVLVTCETIDFYHPRNVHVCCTEAATHERDTAELAVCPKLLDVESGFTT